MNKFETAENLLNKPKGESMDNEVWRRLIHPMEIEQKESGLRTMSLNGREITIEYEPIKNEEDFGNFNEFVERKKDSLVGRKGVTDNSEWSVVKKLTVGKEGENTDINEVLKSYKIFFRPDYREKDLFCSTVGKNIYITGNLNSPVDFVLLLNQIGHDFAAEKNPHNQGERDELTEGIDKVQKERDIMAFSLKTLKPLLNEEQLKDVQIFLHENLESSKFRLKDSLDKSLRGEDEGDEFDPEEIQE